MSANRRSIQLNATSTQNFSIIDLVVDAWYFWHHARKQPSYGTGMHSLSHVHEHLVSNPM